MAGTGLATRLVVGVVLLVGISKACGGTIDRQRPSKSGACLLSKPLENGYYIDITAGERRLRGRRVKPNHVIEARCEPGYGRRGAKLRRCDDSTMTFDRRAPVCEDIDECFYAGLLGSNDENDSWEPSEESSSNSESSLFDPLLVVDLSLLPAVNCHSLGRCVNTPGSFRCQCNRGFEGDGIHSCQKIVEKACEQLQPPSHGSMTGDPTRLVHFSCDEGYRIYGADTRRCMNGKWTGLRPICEVVGCGDPGTPAHGFKVGRNYDINGTVSFFCDEGYELVGHKSRICLDGGDDPWSKHFWSGVQPVCRTVAQSVADIAQNIQTDFVDRLEVFTHSGRGRLAVSDNIGLDLVFAYDTSSSLNRVNFQRGINFTESLLKQFGVSYEKGGTRVAVVSFADRANIEFTYGSDVDTFEKVMEKITLLKDNLGGGTALRGALERVLALSQDMRNESKKALFLMTDGEATVGKDPAAIAESLRRDYGMEIFLVAVGQSIDHRQLRKIASQPYSTHVFLLENFEDLEQLTAIISEKGAEYKRCGQAGNLELPYSSGRQVGKKDANPRAWPWLVQIVALTEDGPFLQCGGALLCEDWVVTAGSCVWNETGLRAFPAEYFLVRLGSHELGIQEDTQQYGVAEVRLHEDFFIYNRDNDVALLKLNQSVNLTSAVRTLCIPSEIEVIRLRSSSQCYIAGWGIVDPIRDVGNNDSIPPVFPQQHIIPLVNDNDCREEMHEMPFPIDKKKLCAGTRYQAPHGACRGDTGAALVCKQIDESWAVTGIASYTNDCTEANKFAVFTRISEFIPWLHRQTANCTMKYEVQSVGGFQEQALQNTK
ncbi:complement factor B-like [Acanthaster planci]|uniref:C3/C5 convertase n=1 Tax=Acanthaster planci TaxID=133434 RepID=A0A8B7ZW08_ACAPL|nr:complement factor B-like [Acanthaster planci]